MGQFKNYNHSDWFSWCKHVLARKPVTERLCSFTFLLFVIQPKQITNGNIHVYYTLGDTPFIPQLLLFSKKPDLLSKAENLRTSQMLSFLASIANWQRVREASRKPPVITHLPYNFCSSIVKQPQLIKKYSYIYNLVLTKLAIAYRLYLMHSV